MTCACSKPGKTTCPWHGEKRVATIKELVEYRGGTYEVVFDGRQSLLAEDYPRHNSTLHELAQSRRQKKKGKHVVWSEAGRAAQGLKHRHA